MIVRKLRLQRSWSQEHLATLTGLSSRTIQRIERGEKPSLESIRMLADAFGIEAQDLQKGLLPSTQYTEEGEEMHTGKVSVTNEEKEVIEYVKRLKGFYKHLIKFVAIMLLLTVINLLTSPQYLWVLWALLGWGIGIVTHAFKVFDIFELLSPKWEKRKIEERLGREL